MTKDEIVVGLDDSDPGRAALIWAADQARLAGSRRAVHVSDWPTGIRADGRPLVPDLVFVQDGDLERADRKLIIEIFEEIAPNDDWSLEFAEGQTGAAAGDGTTRDNTMLFSMRSRL